MPIGRPSKYSEEYVKKAQAYLDCLPEDEVVHSIEGLAVYLGIHRDTIYDWCSQEDKQLFSDIVNKMSMQQGKSLINNTLNRKFEPRTANMLLGKHGYTTKVETDITTKGESINNTSAIEDITNKLNEIYKGTSFTSNGESTNSLDSKTSDKE